jgi:hypothetical protein
VAVREGRTLTVAYAELPPVDRVAAVDMVLEAIRVAKGEPPPPALSSPSQTWFDRLKVVAVDPDVSDKSKEEMATAAADYAKRLGDDEQIAFLCQLKPFLEVAQTMPPTATCTTDFWHDVIVPYRRARGLEVPE